MTDDELIEHLGTVEELPRLTAELMALVRKIPYYCGHADCHNFGCEAIRDARAKCMELFNA